MKGTILGVAVTAMILAVSSIQAAHSAARVNESDSQVTADLNRQNLQTVQYGKSVDPAGPEQGKSAKPSAKAKSLSRAYAIRAKTAKQKRQLAKSKKQSLKAKKQLAKSKKQPLKAKKKEAT